MSRPPRWRKPRCASKKAAWRTQGDALRHLNRLALQNAQAVAPLPFELRGAYHCRCGAWHLTKQDQAETSGTASVGKRTRPAAARHLWVAPDVAAAPPAPKPAPVVTFDPTGPISERRRAHWAAMEGERIRANLDNPWPWRSAA